MKKVLTLDIYHINVANVTNKKNQDIVYNMHDLNQWWKGEANQMSEN